MKMSASRPSARCVPSGRTKPKPASIAAERADDMLGIALALSCFFVPLPLMGRG